MSRVGKLPVNVPAGVDVSIKDSNISVKGAGGTLQLTLNSLVFDGDIHTSGHVDGKFTYTGHF